MVATCPPRMPRVSFFSPVYRSTGAAFVGDPPLRLAPVFGRPPISSWYCFPRDHSSISRALNTGKGWDSCRVWAFLRKAKVKCGLGADQPIAVRAETSKGVHTSSSFGYGSVFRAQAQALIMRRFSAYVLLDLLQLSVGASSFPVSF